MGSERGPNVDDLDRFRLEGVLGWPELIGTVLVSVDGLIGDRRSEEEKEGGGESWGGGGALGRVLDWEVESGVGGERVGD
ncbi:hypothetical protein TB2_032518 [Malus domestica]